MRISGTDEKTGWAPRVHRFLLAVLALWIGSGAAACDRRFERTGGGGETGVRSDTANNRGDTGERSRDSSQPDSAETTGEVDTRGVSDTGEADVRRDGSADTSSETDTGDDVRPTQGLLEHVGFEDETTAIFTSEGETGVPDIDEALQFVDVPVRAGDRALRVKIESSWDFSDVEGVRVNPVVEASERRRLQSNGYSVYGVPFWTGFSLHVPSDWTPDSDIEEIAQFERDVSSNDGASTDEKYASAGAPRGSGVPLSLRVRGDELRLLNDTLPQGVDQFDPQFSDNPTLATLEAGRWYDIVLRIVWSNQNDAAKGSIKVWVDGTVVYEDESENVPRDVQPPRPMNFGIHKWPWQGGAPNQETRVYVFDEFRFATDAASYETVAP